MIYVHLHSSVMFCKNQAYVDDTSTGQVLRLPSFAQFLLPLAVLEAYFRGQRRVGASLHFGFALRLLTLTIGKGVDIFGTLMGMWLPRL